MPFPRNWLEELIAEYMQLEGYFVETGYPRHIEKAGGREEFDVIGIKLEQDGTMTVRHVEAGRAQNLEKRKQKVDKQLKSSSVEKELGKIFGKEATDKRESWFVVEDIKERSKIFQKLKVYCTQKGVELVSFEELREKIEQRINEWKKENEPKSHAAPTLPENLWLLKMLDRMNEAKKAHARI